MSKVAAYILLSCLLVYIGGYQLVSVCYRLEIQTQMAVFVKEQPSDKTQTRINFKSNNGKITDGAFTWREENREFTYQGYMYDVIKMIKTDSMITIICYYDKDETELEQHLVQYQKRQQPNNSEPIMGFKKLASTVFLPVEKIVFVKTYLISSTRFNAYQDRLLQQIRTVFLPPPDDFGI